MSSPRPEYGSLISSVTNGIGTAPPKTAPLTKSKLWPVPKYRSLAIAGHSPAKLRIFRFLYEWLPGKPRTVLPRTQLYYEQAVVLFRDTAIQWLESTTVPSNLSVSHFGIALRTVLDRCWAESASDTAYFTARYERSDRGCQLHVILGAESPYKKVPNHKAFELIQRQLQLGWPVPRPAYEAKGYFVLSPEQISLESGAGFIRARWSESAAKDRGFFSIFDDDEEAGDWLAGLSPFLVFTDRGATRLLSHHATEALARAKAKALAFPAQAAASGVTAQSLAVTVGNKA